MPVNSEHPLYTAYRSKWSKVRTAIEGEEAIKAAGELYLPMLSGQTEDKYANYLKRAMFYGASGRTVQGLTGAVFRKPPEVQFPTDKLAILESVGRNQEPLENVAKSLVEEVVGVGRAGVLVDASAFEDSTPYIALYCAESIINWLTIPSKGGEQVIEVVLRESKERRRADDPYVTETVTYYRVLRLGFLETTDADAQRAMEQGPIYFQELWREEKKLDENRQEIINFVLEKVVIPKMRGGRFIRNIPFWVANDTELGLEPRNPPLLALVNVNLSHYRNSADLEHGRHFTALPTAWVAGFPPDKILMIGSEVAWVSESTSAKAGFLEFTGAGLGHLQNGMQSKERLMAVLGARMLEELPTDGTEAAETVKLRQSGEASSLASVSQTCSSALTKALRVLSDWLGIRSTEPIAVELNRDFQTSGIPPNVLQNLIMAAQQGLVSWDTFFFNLKRGEMIPDHITPEQEWKLITKGYPQGNVSAAGNAQEPQPKEDSESDTQET